MTNLVELKKQYDKLGEEIKKLEQLNSKGFKKDQEAWWFSYDSDGNVTPMNHVKVGNVERANKNLSAGIFFKSRSDAAQELLRRQAMFKLRTAEGAGNFDSFKRPWTIGFIKETNTVAPTKFYSSTPINCVFYATQGQAKAAKEMLDSEELRVLFYAHVEY